MKEVLAAIERWRAEGEEDIALATVVRVHGSAPRLPGAHLALTRSGRMAGSVSGGCIEGDVFARAIEVLRSRGPVVARYEIADEAGLRVGLSCGGSVDVLIEPFAGGAVWSAVRQAVGSGRPAALATALAPESLLGRKLAVLEDGSAVGSIDPDVDGCVVAGAARLLGRGGTCVLPVTWRDGEGMVFGEAFGPPPRLFIVGATHVAVVLARMARTLGFRVVVIDPRATFATRERFPDCDELLTEWPQEALGAAQLDGCSYVVILTHDSKFDVPALRQALGSAARYIGIIGSRRTHGRRQQELREQGFRDADLGRLRGPIGLDIGARTPEEIALAILAEMVAVRSGRTGRPLVETSGPIHVDG